MLMLLLDMKIFIQTLNAIYHLIQNSGIFIFIVFSGLAGTWLHRIKIKNSVEVYFLKGNLNKMLSQDSEIITMKLSESTTELEVILERHVLLTGKLSAKNQNIADVLSLAKVPNTKLILKASSSVGSIETGYFIFARNILAASSECSRIASTQKGIRKIVVFTDQDYNSVSYAVKLYFKQEYYLNSWSWQELSEDCKKEIFEKYCKLHPSSKHRYRIKDVYATEQDKQMPDVGEEYLLTLMHDEKPSIICTGFQTSLYITRYMYWDENNAASIMPLGIFAQKLHEENGHGQVHIISAISGMGKSVIMNELAKILSVRCIVYASPVNQFDCHVCPISDKISILQHFWKIPLQIDVCKLAIDKRVKFFVLLDGFSEASRNQQSDIIQFIRDCRNIKEPFNMVFVLTMREPWSDDRFEIENNLVIYKHAIEPLNFDSKKALMFEVLKSGTITSLSMVELHVANYIEETKKLGEFSDTPFVVAQLAHQYLLKMGPSCSIPKDIKVDEMHNFFINGRVKDYLVKHHTHFSANIFTDLIWSVQEDSRYFCDNKELLVLRCTKRAFDLRFKHTGTAGLIEDTLKIIVMHAENPDFFNDHGDLLCGSLVDYFVAYVIHRCVSLIKCIPELCVFRQFFFRVLLSITSPDDDSRAFRFNDVLASLNSMIDEQWMKELFYETTTPDNIHMIVFLALKQKHFKLHTLLVKKLYYNDVWFMHRNRPMTYFLEGDDVDCAVDFLRTAFLENDIEVIKLFVQNGYVSIDDWKEMVPLRFSLVELLQSKRFPEEYKNDVADLYIKYGVPYE